jgi:hypothetical protein
MAVPTSTPIAHANTAASSATALRISHVRGERWSNWGRTAHCQPDYFFHARTVDDLRQIIGFARDEGRRIRAVATGHSWSAIVPTDEILVNVQALNRVHLDLRDADHPRVTMECGATVLEVNNVLEKAGYALPFNVVLESVRFGGLIATGSHGSGWNHQTLSDLVHAIEIFGADGELRHFEAGVDSEEVMNAARLNLGMFGLIYRLTLNVQPTWNVRAQDRLVPIEATLDQLPALIAAHDNLELFWWPFTDRLWLKTWHRVEGATTAPALRHDQVDRTRSAIEQRLYGGVLGVMRRFPKTTPRGSAALLGYTPSRRDMVVNVMEAIHYRRSLEVAKMGCLEIAFKVDPDLSTVKAAMQVAFDMNRHYAARREYPFNVTMNTRFIHNSDCWLSPAFGEGHTCYIEVLSAADPAHWRRFSGEVGREWLTLPHALPHWAKEYKQIPGVTDHIKREMGANIARFNRIKAELKVDPDDMFVNPTLAEVFA